MLNKKTGVHFNLTLLRTIKKKNTLDRGEIAIEGKHSINAVIHGHLLNGVRNTRYKVQQMLLQEEQKVVKN